MAKAKALRQFIEPLVRWKPDFTFDPVLLEGWEINDDATRYVCVRYGNVVASRGSVIPMLVDQVAAPR